MHPLDRLVDEGLVATQVRVDRFTTYRLGGPARYLAEVGDPSRLSGLAEAWRRHPIPVLVIGKGSNLVVADAGFDGLVIRLTGVFLHIDVTGEEVVAGGAAPLPNLARGAVKEGRLGLEFLVGIPGSVGGAVRQNAGCHGSETRDVLAWAEVFDLTGGTLRHATGEELGLSYRHSDIGPDQIVTRAGFVTTPGDRRMGETRLREITRWRKENQPGGMYNAGSVFKNPPGDFAGRIIDRLGLKGLTVGGASVSEKHANFFVATPEASAADVYALVRDIRRRVLAETGIDLEPELVFAGRFED